MLWVVQETFVHEVVGTVRNDQVEVGRATG